MKKGNSVVVLLGRVHASSSNHDVREFSVRIYNMVDMLTHLRGEFNSDDTLGYLETEELEDILENLRNNISICYHGSGITSIIKEEDSN